MKLTILRHRPLLPVCCSFSLFLPLKGHITSHPSVAFIFVLLKNITKLSGKKYFIISCFFFFRHSVLLSMSMERGEYLFSGNAWFKERLDGEDGYFWRKARKMFLFNHDLSSALNLFNFNYKAIKTISRPEGTILMGSRKTNLDPNEEREHRPGQSWTDDAQNSIRTLLDRIVTRWVPKYLYSTKINTNKLHPTLTPLPLRFVPTTYGKLF